MIQTDLSLVKAPLVQNGPKATETPANISVESNSNIQFKLIAGTDPNSTSAPNPPALDESIGEIISKTALNVEFASKPTLSKPDNEPGDPKTPEPEQGGNLFVEEPNLGWRERSDPDRTSQMIEPDISAVQFEGRETGEIVAKSAALSLMGTVPNADPVLKSTNDDPSKLNAPADTKALPDVGLLETDAALPPVLTQVPSPQSVSTPDSGDDRSVKDLLAGSKSAAHTIDRGLLTPVGRAPSQVRGDVAGQTAVSNKLVFENQTSGFPTDKTISGAQTPPAELSNQRLVTSQTIVSGGQTWVPGMQASDGRSALPGSTVGTPIEGQAAGRDGLRSSGSVDSKLQATPIEPGKAAQPTVHNAPTPALNAAVPPQGAPDTLNATVARISSAEASPHTLPGLSNDLIARVSFGFDTSNPGSVLQKTSVVDIARQIAPSIPNLSARALPNAVELTLAPQELGRVRMLFSPQDGGMSVLLQSERPDTIELMRRNIGVLQSELEKMGFEGLEFTFGQQGNSHWQDGTAEWLDRIDRASSLGPSDDAEPDNIRNTWRRSDRPIIDAANGRIDIYL